MTRPRPGCDRAQVGSATLLLMGYACRAASATDRRDHVLAADHRTSASDARIALSLALGKDIETLDPSTGTGP